MAVNKRLLQGAAAAGEFVPSEHFGVVLYEGDGSSSHSINGGKFGGAANFNGTSSTIVIPNSIEQPLIFAKEFGVSMWFSLASLPTGSDEDFLISLYQEGYLDIRVKANGVIQGKVAEETTGTDRIVTSANSVISANTWYHVVWTGETNNLILYVNGSSVATGSTWNGTYYHSNAGCRIGSKSGPSFYFNGKIDQTRIFQKYLSSSEVSTLYAETVETVESLDPLSEDTTDTLQVLGDSSCIATYRFENDETDLSGNYNGTGTAIQYAAGRYGQAASFNGSGSIVDVSSISSFPSGNASRTISFWMYSDSYANGGILAYGTASSNQAFAFYISSSQLIMTFYLVNANINYALSTGQWYHVVATHDGTTFKAYINGSQEYSDTRTLNTGTTAFRIGGVPWNNGGEFFNGKIDQVRVFNKALSASEVTTLYNENSLVASYRFEGNANDDTRNYDGSPSNVTYEYGLGFTPDFVWLKQRDATRDHYLEDSSRGAGKYIRPSTTDMEGTSAVSIQSFDTGGFTVGTGASYNSSGGDYVAWCLKANGGTTSSNTDGSVTSTVQANQDAGFSIVKINSATGTSADTIGHGLSQAPEMIFWKTTSTTGNWSVYHSALGNTKGLYLNLTNAETTSQYFWNNTSPTSSVFTAWGSEGNSHIGYCFHSVEGFSKFGSYVGNGSTNGPIVETGFEPAFVMTKQTNTASNWVIVDNKRSTTNPRDKGLRPNTNDTESTVSNNLVVDFLSNGFQLKQTSGSNDNNGNFIYMAFAADPDTEAPTVAKSFSTITYTGTGSTQSVEGLGFQPNLVWIKVRSAAGYAHVLFDSIRGATKRIYPSETAAENSNGQLSSFDSDGFTFSGGGSSNVSGQDMVAWSWKADDNEPTINTEGSIDSLVSANANAGFSIVKYEGNGTSGATIGHGLSAAPEMIIVKNLDGTYSWVVYNSTLGATKYLHLDASDAQQTTSLFFNDTNPSSTVFTLGTHAAVNASGNEIIAYCFHSVSSYSKIGSYSGNGGSNSITGLGFQPDFLLIKDSTSTGNWLMYDSLRTVSVGDNAGTANARPYILANISGKENGVTSYNVNLDSDGFSINTSSSELNSSGETYIYMAFKIN